MGEVDRPAGRRARGDVADRARWVRPECHPMLMEGEVHVWKVAVEASAASLPSLATILSEEERAEALAFVSSRERARFVTVRGVLRRLWGSYLGLKPQAIVLTRGPHGKPEMAAGGREVALSFNVAHAADIGLIAVAGGCAVGVDVETVRRDFDWEPIARRFFTAQERVDLMSLPAWQRPEAFTALWTRKEASLKAAGLGLAHGLEEVEVSTGVGHGAKLIAAPEEMLPTSRWAIIDLEPADGYRGCLVADSRDVVVRQWIWRDAHPRSLGNPVLDWQRPIRARQ